MQLQRLQHVRPFAQPALFYASGSSNARCSQRGHALPSPSVFESSAFPIFPSRCTRQSVPKCSPFHWQATPHIPFQLRAFLHHYRCDRLWIKILLPSSACVRRLRCSRMHLHVAGPLHTPELGGFPKLPHYHFGGHHNKDYSILGLHGGPLTLGNYQLTSDVKIRMLRRVWRCMPAGPNAITFLRQSPSTGRFGNVAPETASEAKEIKQL